MKRFQLFPLLFMLSGYLLTVATGDDTHSLTYKDMGLSLEIPVTWQTSGLVLKTSIAEFYRLQGKTYAGADSNRVVSGVLSYFEMEVDSTKLPSPSAYNAHLLTVQLHGYLGWYSRWLWSQGKKSLWEPFPAKEGKVVWLEQEELDASDNRNVIEDAFALEYVMRPESAEVDLQGQIYYVVRGARCYRIAIEGAREYYEENRSLYESVLRSIEFNQ